MRFAVLLRTPPALVAALSACLALVSAPGGGGQDDFEVELEITGAVETRLSFTDVGAGFGKGMFADSPATIAISFDDDQGGCHGNLGFRVGDAEGKGDLAGEYELDPDSLVERIRLSCSGPFDVIQSTTATVVITESGEAAVSGTFEFTGTLTGDVDSGGEVDGQGTFRVPWSG